MCKSKYNLILFVAGIFLLSTGCGTTKKFAIQSIPSDALITVHQTADVESINLFPAPPDKNETTPFQKTITFWKDETLYIAVAKRGYKPVFQPVTVHSSLEVNLPLERIEGAVTEAAIFDNNKLKNSSFSLLPINVEVLIHSGVGRMDKNTYSSELSQQTTLKLTDELKKAYAVNNPTAKQETFLNPALESDWVRILEPTKKFLSGLNPVRLPYYSYPPLLSSGVTGARVFLEQAQQLPDKPGAYLYYIHAKCVSETSGRKVGNFFLALAGATVHAYGVSVGTYFYYDPSAFNPDSGTLLTIYVIDAATSEVLWIDQNYVGYDITKDDDLLKLVKLIVDFPQKPKKN
jgi:hypothetical protein